MVELNTVYHKDCFDLLSEIGDESVDLLILDPPYNIDKDTWDKIPDYLKWCDKWIKESERILKKTGSIYIFHNDFKILREFDEWIEKNTGLFFRNLIVWNKRFKESRNYEYLNTWVKIKGLRNYYKMAEYILFYTKQTNEFKTPFSRLITTQMDKLKIKQIELSKLFPSKSGGLTGWVSNKIRGTQIPTEKQWNLICDKLEMYADEFNYKNVLMQYRKECYTFNNQQKYHSVWDFDFTEKDIHKTPKPVSLISNIVLHSSNKGDIIVDFFCGTGATAMACKKHGRNFICGDSDASYVEIANKNIQNMRYVKRNLFDYMHKNME